MKTFYIITGMVGDKEVFWQGWISAAVKGRPKWVKDLTAACLFANETIAVKTARGEGSTHWHTDFGKHLDGQTEGVGMEFPTISRITVRPATIQW